MNDEFDFKKLLVWQKAIELRSEMCRYTLAHNKINSSTHKPIKKYIEI
jgi:hypothetical protein